MRILFIHQNFPAQYVHLASTLARDPANEVVAIGSRPNALPSGVRRVIYKPVQGSSTDIHPFAGDFESKVIRGQAAARAARGLKADGFTPDIICGHPGWGETLFMRDVWPDTPQLTYMEFFYQGLGADFGFDPNFGETDPEELWKLRARNATFLLALDSSDWSVSPTQWQWQQLPRPARARTSIIHDGIDTNKAVPNPHATVTLGRSGVCRVGDEIITFVNRNLEPYRGYHMFMRALPEILKRRPKARAILVGGEGVSYGAKPANGRSWKSIFLNEVAANLDMERVHFVGQIPYSTYLNLLQVSAAHVYLTYPFILSWSLMEAMAAGCLVIGSDTSPVVEVVQHENNGLLVDFFSREEIASKVIRALEQPEAHRDLRVAARRTIVDRYDLASICLPRHLELLHDTAAGRRPGLNARL